MRGGVEAVFRCTLLVLAKLQFSSKHDHGRRRFKPEADLVSLNTDQRHDDPIADDDSLSDFAGQNKHNAPFRDDAPQPTGLADALGNCTS